MSDTKEIFFTLEGKSNREILEVPSHFCVKDLVDTIAKKHDIGGKIDDLKVHPEDESNVLDEKTPVTDIQKDVHLGRCTQISVQIYYEDKTQELKVAPSTRIARLRETAIGHFKPDDFRNKDYRLANASTEEVQEETLPIGILAQDGTCSAKFNLLPKEKWQG